jgi:two-component system, OmpR family, phosphate regulon response regulator PhoB
VRPNDTAAAAQVGGTGAASNDVCGTRLAHGRAYLDPADHMPRVLIVDDQLEYRRALRTGLQKCGYEVIDAARGADALDLAQREPPDLLLLDLELPDLSGITICRRLKDGAATAAIPVMIVSARNEEHDRVAGFEAGADDYVTKPFSLRELLLRMRVLLQRKAQSRGKIISLGALRVDLEAHRVLVDGVRTNLTRLEFALLRVLCERAACVVSRDDLLDCVWGLELDSDGRIVDGQIRRLRQKLGPAGNYISTVRGTGYRLDMP